MSNFWQGKRVFMTGHTGFKGTWLSQILLEAGAVVTGYALSPDKDSLFALSGISASMTSVYGDIRNLTALQEAFTAAQPEIVLHLAAQPLVRAAYQAPVYTYETNVMGTVHLLECVRQQESVKSVLNVTTDKVYQNKEWPWPYRESDRLDGFDPYSNSKSCSELVTHSYQNSFLKDKAVSTARAGNVIGGGDFAADRIIPDCIRAVIQGQEIVVRAPYSVRPYQHVLEPLYAYLLIAQRQYEDGALADNYNVGPMDADCVATGMLVDCFCKAWGEGARWRHQSDNGPHEAGLLKLDCSKIKMVLGWQPKWNSETAVQKTVSWTKAYQAGQAVAPLMKKQIQEYRGME